MCILTGIVPGYTGWLTRRCWVWRRCLGTQHRWLPGGVRRSWRAQRATMAPPPCGWRSASLIHSPQVAKISPRQSALLACQMSSLQLPPRLHVSKRADLSMGYADQ